MSLYRRILFFTCFILSHLTTVHLVAQNGLYDVRIKTKMFDCDANAVILQLQVRASSLANGFRLGDANYRLNYDPRQISNPTIVSQDNFSSQTPSLDNNYGQQNINGSSEGTTKAILSLNCFYSGGGQSAKWLDTTWTTVSCLKFNVKDTTKCFSINWHDDKTFPITGMNEVVITSTSPYQYATQSVPASGVFIGIDGCFTNSCDNQPPYVTRTLLEVYEDYILTECLEINDPNLTDKHSVTICQNPTNGSLTTYIDNNSHRLCVDYKPNDNFAGVDSICLIVCDSAGQSLCDTVRLTINVIQVPDTPSVSMPLLTVSAGSSLDSCLLIQDNDVNDTFTATICNVNRGEAQVTITNNQLCIHYNAPALFTGKDSVCVTVCDAFGLCQQINIPISITPCKDIMAPVLSCPAQVVVSLGGSIISDSSQFMINGMIADNCNNVNFNYNMPTATDDCGTPSVKQLSGTTSGNAFRLGNNVLTFEAKDNAGKTSRCQVNVFVKPIQLLTVDTVSYCLYEVLYAEATLYPNSSYQWQGPRFNINSNVLTFPVVTAAQKGLYIVNATIGRNCQYKDTLVVKMREAPVVEDDIYIMPINGELSDNVLNNDSLLTNAFYTTRVKDSIDRGTLNFKSNGSFTYSSPQKFAGVVGFTYEVCYDNCPNTCQKGAVSIKVASEKRISGRGANIITPNDDGDNDVLTIEGFDHTSPNNKSEMTIYSQWGELVYKAKPYMNDWGGTFNGSPLPVGTYYYIFKKDEDAIPIATYVSIIK